MPACYCIGPQNCGKTECILVRNYLNYHNRLREKLVTEIDKIFDEIVEDIYRIEKPDSDEYQDLEDEIIGCKKLKEYPPVSIPSIWTTPDTIISPPSYTTIYPDDPCASCPNSPRNGGSGICHCTIPYLRESTTI